MLSRIMRHPAGLMRKALGRNFLAGAFRRMDPRETPPPDYWADRFSTVGIALMAPPPPMPADEAAGLDEEAPAEALLAAQDGKGASFLNLPSERIRSARP